MIEAARAHRGPAGYLVEDREGPRRFEALGKCERPLPRPSPLPGAARGPAEHQLHAVRRGLRVEEDALNGSQPRTFPDRYGLSALLGHGYTVDNRAQPEMATFGVFRRRVPPIAMQNRRLPLDHWGQVVVRSDFR